MEGQRAALDKEYLIDILELTHVMDRDVAKLSVGELQRFAIGIVAVQDADIYMFDEPSSYLDVKQRLKASRRLFGIVVGD